MIPEKTSDAFNQKIFSARINPRINWMDGLRGVAALGVCIDHNLIFLINKQNDIGILDKINKFIVLLVNFSIAVPIFFILSGYVLTKKYSQNKLGIYISIVQRLLRLWLPAAAALVFAYALFLSNRSAHIGIQNYNPSVFFNNFPDNLRIYDLFHEIFLEIIVVGFPNASNLPYSIVSNIGSVVVNKAIIPVLWTLHTEFFGSVMLIIFCNYFYKSRYNAIILSVLIAATFGSYVSLFLVGYLFYKYEDYILRENLMTMKIISLIFGFMLYVGFFKDEFILIYKYLPAKRLPLFGSDYALSTIISAISIFYFVFVSEFAKEIFANRIATFLGRISYSLYLVHHPIMMTLTCSLFIFLHNYVKYIGAQWLVIVTSISMSIAIATLGERYVDAPAVRMARRLLVGDPNARKQTT